MRGVLAACVAAGVFAIAAARADATTDRVDYSDQANPICASTNKQYVQLYESFEAAIERLDNRRVKNRKQARKLNRKVERLYEQLPFQIIALYKAELEQLRAIAPPPGYEDTVARWLGTRTEIAALYDQYLQIEQELEGSIVDSGKSGKRPSRKAVKRAQKRRENLRRLEDRIEEQFLTDSEVDLELGAKMGAAYCVTGADGEIAVNFLDDWDD
jgi:DNA repair ATPase RecN